MRPTTTLRQHLQVLKSQQTGVGFALSSQDFDLLKSRARFVQTTAAELGMDFTIQSTARLIELLDQAMALPGNKTGFLANETRKLYQLLVAVVGRMSDDMASRLVLAVPLSMAGYFEPRDPLFGEDVQRAFQSASEDIA